jgi:ketosteroid isomerase-like protein
MTLNGDNMKDMIRCFGEGFNNDDLDTVMEFFADDAVYYEIDGKKNYGKEAIRNTFEPQFRGKYGKQYFEEHDIIIDESAGKACFRWEARFTIGKTVAAIDGLDVFTFENGKIKEKDSYFKSSMPKFKSRIMSPFVILKIIVHLIRFRTVKNKQWKSSR